MLKSTPSSLPARMMSALDMAISGAWILKRRAFDAGLGRELREILEGRDEFRPAIGITRVIDGVHAHENIARRPATSAQPSASASNRVLRAGT